MKTLFNIPMSRFIVIICAILATIIVFAMTAPAMAQQGKRSNGLTTGYSSLGLTLEWHHALNDSYGFRIPVGWMLYKTKSLGNFGLADQADNLDTYGEIRTGGVGFLADWYPRIGRFRLSLGAIYSLYKIDTDFTGAPGIPVNIGGVDYDNTSFHSTASFKNSIVPMFAMGYAGDLSGGGSFSFEFGALVNGGYDVSLEQTGGLAVPQNAIDTQINELREQLNKSKIFPYVRFGITFAF
ncbi:MAG: hypothetical protein ACNYPD_03570 [Candidatus Halichondribacter symbioticus]